MRTAAVVLLAVILLCGAAADAKGPKGPKARPKKGNTQQKECVAFTGSSQSLFLQEIFFGGGFSEAYTPSLRVDMQVDMSTGNGKVMTDIYMAERYEYNSTVDMVATFPAGAYKCWAPFTGSVRSTNGAFTTYAGQIQDCSCATNGQFTYTPQTAPAAFRKRQIGDYEPLWCCERTQNGQLHRYALNIIYTQLFFPEGQFDFQPFGELGPKPVQAKISNPPVYEQIPGNFFEYNGFAAESPSQGSSCFGLGTCAAIAPTAPNMAYVAVAKAAAKEKALFEQKQ